MKTTKDNFIYKIVTDKSKDIFNSGLFELYALHNDESESLINTFDELNNHLENGLEIGIEVGYFEPKENENKKAIYWSVEDFEGVADRLFCELQNDNPKEFENFTNWEQFYDKTKFPQMLEQMIKNHDANEGITWQTIEFYVGLCEIKN